jgi:hypothetical protein
MSLESIEINTSREKFFLEYLILKKPVIDSVLTKINKHKISLSEKPMQVLAQLLYYYDTYKDRAEAERWSVLFSKTTKDLICDNLGMKEHHLNIYLSQLRSMGILEKKKIRNWFIVNAEDDHSLNFKFRLNGHSKQ